MRIWLDAQLSPGVATWMTATFDLDDVRAVQSDALALLDEGQPLVEISGRW